MVATGGAGQLIGDLKHTAREYSLFRYHSKAYVILFIVCFSRDSSPEQRHRKLLQKIVFAVPEDSKKHRHPFKLTDWSGLSTSARKALWHARISAKLPPSPARQAFT